MTSSDPTAWPATIERLFRRLKGVRRSCSRLDRIDVIFLGLVTFALIFNGLRQCERAFVVFQAGEIHKEE